MDSNEQRGVLGHLSQLRLSVCGFLLYRVVRPRLRVKQCHVFDFLVTVAARTCHEAGVY